MAAEVISMQTLAAEVISMQNLLRQVARLINAGRPGPNVTGNAIN